MTERLQSYERQAREAEKELAAQPDIPPASVFNFKSALEKANGVIERQKKALAVKSIIEAEKEKQGLAIQHLHEAVSSLKERLEKSEADRAEERLRSAIDMRNLRSSNQNLHARLEETEKFFRWNTEAAMMRNDYEREQREEARQREAERQRQAQEREQQQRREQEERARQAREQEQQKAQEAERQREEREQQRARELERRPRGMGMGL